MHKKAGIRLVRLSRHNHKPSDVTNAVLRTIVADGHGCKGLPGGTLSKTIQVP